MSLTRDLPNRSAASPRGQGSPSTGFPARRILPFAPFLTADFLAPFFALLLKARAACAVVGWLLIVDRDSGLRGGITVAYCGQSQVADGSEYEIER